MSRDSDHQREPWEAGKREALPIETKPPAELEDRVVESLLRRNLIRPSSRQLAIAPGARVWGTLLKTAACFALVAMGVVIGRMSLAGGPTAPAALSGAETDLYAFLLYETAGYDRPLGDEARGRYQEYSRWVAEARQRGLFVAGEDLEVERGWLLPPAGGQAQIVNATSISADAPLSGIFFIRADDDEQALDLALELPHLRHGGRVLVQKTIPTDSPPGSE